MTPFPALSLPAQVALSWLVNVGGAPWSSDLPHLHGLEAAGLAHRDADNGEWRATDKGRACYHARFDRIPLGPPYTPAYDGDPYFQQPQTDTEESA